MSHKDFLGEIFRCSGATASSPQGLRRRLRMLGATRSCLLIRCRATRRVIDTVQAIAARVIWPWSGARLPEYFRFSKKPQFSFTVPER